MKILVSLPEQCLCLFDDRRVLQRRYAVSTALNGPGERRGSYCTPRGRHRIRAKIGAGAPSGAVFAGRRATGEVYSAALAQSAPQRDWILTRILWLCGEESGINRSGDVDSMRRYIYIHGSPDDGPFGQAASHGCIRMRNRDIAELFELVPPGTKVDIRDQSTAFPLRIDVSDWASVCHLATQIRDEVFVREQGVPAELERDPDDAENLHALAWVGDEPVGTARLKPDGRIGRMAVRGTYRYQGIGHALLDALIVAARTRGLAEVTLNAQVAAIGFYVGEGFSMEGRRFTEAGIEHQSMRRTLLNVGQPSAMNATSVPPAGAPPGP